MKSIFAILILAVSLAAVAQEKPAEKIPVLTAKEQLDLRNLQVQDLQAQSAFQAKQTAAIQQMQNALQQTPEFQAAQESTKRLQAAVAEMKSAHRVDETKIHLCDGPDAGYCKDVKVGELVFREVPIQQAKK